MGHGGGRKVSTPIFHEVDRRPLRPHRSNARSNSEVASWQLNETWTVQFFGLSKNFCSLSEDSDVWTERDTYPFLVLASSCGSDDIDMASEIGDAIHQYTSIKNWQAQSNDRKAQAQQLRQFSSRVMHPLPRLDFIENQIPNISVSSVFYSTWWHAYKPQLATGRYNMTLCSTLPPPPKHTPWSKINFHQSPHHLISVCFQLYIFRIESLLCKEQANQTEQDYTLLFDSNKLDSKTDKQYADLPSDCCS